MQTKEGIAVAVALHSSKQPMKRTGFICGGLWVSHIHLGTAALVLDHGEVRGCFTLRSCLFRWKLSLYITSDRVGLRQCLSKGMEGRTLLQEKKKYCQYLKATIN